MAYDLNNASTNNNLDGNRYTNQHTEKILQSLKNENKEFDKMLDSVVKMFATNEKSLRALKQMVDYQEEQLDLVKEEKILRETEYQNNLKNLKNLSDEERKQMEEIHQQKIKDLDDEIAREEKYRDQVNQRYLKQLETQKRTDLDNQIKQQNAELEAEQNLFKIKNNNLSILSKNRLSKYKLEAKQQLDSDKNRYSQLEKLIKSGAATESEQLEFGNLTRKLDSIDNFGVDLTGNGGQTGVLQGITDSLGGIPGVLSAVSDTVFKLANKLDNQFEKVEAIYRDYQKDINARLGNGQSNDTPFEDLMKDMKKNFGTSTVVKMEDVLKNLKTAVDQGIARDVEMMAFIQTAKEDIQSTFNAFDSNLLRVIRLQDSNSTAARLGMESYLNDLFVTYFKDTSYLNDAYDSVSGVLVDAMSQMSAQQGAQFEYTVQKWLGALYETGLSNTAVSNIASGIADLATGNVNALGGNTQLQNLIALSANRAGLDYAGMLTSGITSNQVNELMRSMVEYLADIAGNTQNNKVVMSAFGNTLGNLSVADIKAFSNLSSQVSTIYSKNMDYSQMVQNSEREFYNIRERQHQASWIDNITSNFMFGSMSGVVNSDAGYLSYKISDMLEPIVGAIPGLVGDALKLVVGAGKAIPFGISFVSNLVNGAGQLLTGNHSLNQNAASLLSQNTADVYTTGNGDILSATKTTSASALVGSGAAYDSAVQSVADQSADAKQFMEDAGLREDQDKLNDFEDDIQEKFKTLNENLFSNPATGNGTLVNIAEVTKQTYDRLNSLINASKDYINVNLTGLSLDDDSPLPIRFSSLGAQQLYNQIKISTDRFGVGGADQATLQDLIDLFSPVESTDKSINVHLTSTDIGMQEVLNNTADRWNQRY